MDEDQRPSLDAFLAAPVADVARVAPATVIYTAGGSRRRAALEGLSPESDAYARWARERIMAVFGLLFRHGVRHIFTLGLIESGFHESGGYPQRALAWARWGIAGPESLADYARFGWRVRLLGAEGIPELSAAAAQLQAATPGAGAQTLWWSIVPEAGAPWQALLAAAGRAGAYTQAEAIQALYGEAIPPAGLLLSFGKPVVSPSIVPPLLVGDMQCYWSQRAGYELDEPELRTILYDYAYLRPTWRQDKTGRAEAALDHRAAWEHGGVLGVGQRLGPFWYPAPFPAWPTISHLE